MLCVKKLFLHAILGMCVVSSPTLPYPTFLPTLLMYLHPLWVHINKQTSTWLLYHMILDSRPLLILMLGIPVC